MKYRIGLNNIKISGMPNWIHWKFTWRRYSKNKPSHQNQKNVQSENNLTAPAHEIVSIRMFNTDQATLFNAWENPGILSQWWGPKGFTNTFHAFNFTPGGTWNFTMHAP